MVGRILPHGMVTMAVLGLWNAKITVFVKEGVGSVHQAGGWVEFSWGGFAALL